ncbi:MAG TPA: exodeoxyribonuclease VII large subunit, partial [Balneolaceae bacterium]|nr:exodeoxyribonuclease VII large subunit [Balneolaceae bacterium]
MAQPDLFATSTLSVSQLTGEIKSLLEDNFFDVRVEGEISNASTSRNGHTYFTLKDDDAQLSCVIWSSTARRLGVELIDGQQIIAGGDIQVYPPHGRYQLIVRSVKQAGVGALQKAFEKLKAQLKSEGLFDDVHKKPLPK